MSTSTLTRKPTPLPTLHGWALTAVQSGLTEARRLYRTGYNKADADHLLVACARELNRVTAAIRSLPETDRGDLLERVDFLTEVMDTLVRP